MSIFAGIREAPQAGLTQHVAAKSRPEGEHQGPEAEWGRKGAGQYSVAGFKEGNRVKRGNGGGRRCVPGPNKGKGTH